MLRAIAYVSTATRPLQSVEIDGLLLDARGFNAMHGVTGVLLFNGSSFFQLFEGLPASVEATYERIRAAKCHADICELMNGPAPTRRFDNWHMGFATARATELQALAQARWEDSVPVTRSSFDPDDGISLLTFYWNRWSAEASR